MTISIYNLDTKDIISYLCMLDFRKTDEQTFEILHDLVREKFVAKLILEYQSQFNRILQERIYNSLCCKHCCRTFRHIRHRCDPRLVEYVCDCRVNTIRFHYLTSAWLYVCPRCYFSQFKPYGRKEKFSKKISDSILNE